MYIDISIIEVIALVLICLFVLILVLLLLVLVLFLVLLLRCNYYLSSYYHDYYSAGSGARGRATLDGPGRPRGKSRAFEGAEHALVEVFDARVMITIVIVIVLVVVLVLVIVTVIVIVIVMYIYIYICLNDYYCL